jgi:hypothetical protein
MRLRLTSPTVFLALASILVIAFVSMTPEMVPPKGGPPLKPPTKAKWEALAIALEMNKLVVSLAGLIFGAVGALVVSKDGVARLDTRQNILAMLTLLNSSAAIYFSYVTYDKLMVSLSNNFLELHDKALRWPRLFQLNSLGLAVVTLAALFLTFSVSKQERIIT